MLADKTLDQLRYMSLLNELSSQPRAVYFEKTPSILEHPTYHAVLRSPTSISDVRTMVKQDEIRSWYELGTEVQRIWNNTKAFYGESLDIAIAARNLEVCLSFIVNRIS